VSLPPGADSPGGRLRISRQEAALVVDRLLMVAGVPLGNVVAVREFILDAECAVGGALRALRDDAPGLRADARRPALRYRRTGPGAVEADGGGRSGLLLGPDVADLAGGAAGHSTAGHSAIVTVRVTSVRDPAFLRTLAAAGAVPGMAAHVRIDQERPEAGGAALNRGVGTCTLTCGGSRGEGGGGAERRLRAAAAGGLPVSRGLWAWLSRESARALTPDSAVSRRHAGRLEPGRPQPGAASHRSGGPA
jgi:hypothetical protein